MKRKKATARVAAWLEVLCLGAWSAWSSLFCRAQGAPPVLAGKVVFHRYTSYRAQDGQLWTYEFSTRRLSALSRDWPLHHAINAHFSPDGRSLAFMALSTREAEAGEWDIFSWKIGDDSPTNLTAGNGLTDEDPKFSPDGKSIVFKQDRQIAIMNADGTQVRVLPIEAPVEAVERSLEESYPIAWFGSRFLYSRWMAQDNRNAQAFSFDLNSGQAQRLPFNVSSNPGDRSRDTSDPDPVSERLVLFSSNRPGGQGAYDLYLGDAQTGAARPLSQLAPPGALINTAEEELGAAYFGPGEGGQLALGIAPATFSEDGGAISGAGGARAAKGKARSQAILQVLAAAS